jgi:hypothetical protein
MDMDWLPRADAGTLRNRRRFPDRRRPGMRPFVPSPASSGREASLAERRRLKKMVNRWAFRWNLDATRLGQINRIADDAERPLGEALALLRWEQYQTPIPGESGATHLDRLILWREALVEYRDQLAGEVDTLETRYRRWLGIHEQWKARGTEEGQAAWDLFMSRTRQAMLEEIKRLDAEIKDLEAQLANPGGGS